MKAVILGAAGCFGQNLAIHLSKTGHTVIGFGRSISKPDPYNLGFLMDYRCFHLVNEFDGAWKEIEKIKPDVIISFAAHAGLVPQSWEYPEAFYAINTLLPVKIAQRLSCRYIHVGSSEVYGSNEYPVGEDAPIRCSSPYAVSKAAADLHLMTLKDDRITVVRPSNCYCPGQSLHRLVPRAVYSAVSGTRMPLQGNAQKSYLHADDLSVAIEMLMRNPEPGVFNVGSAMPISSTKLVSMVAEAFEMGLEDIAEVKEGRANEDQCYWINSEKMIRRGWTETIPLADGIKEMANWGRKYAEKIIGLSPNYEFTP